jgi:hypothetical protein
MVASSIGLSSKEAIFLLKKTYLYYLQRSAHLAQGLDLERLLTAKMVKSLINLV